MSSYKITSPIEYVGKNKTRMSVEFYNDQDILVQSEVGFEVDADSDDGIQEVLSRTARDRSLAFVAVPEEKVFNVPINEKIDASVVNEAAAE